MRECCQCVPGCFGPCFSRGLGEPRHDKSTCRGRGVVEHSEREPCLRACPEWQVTQAACQRQVIKIRASRCQGQCCFQGCQMGCRTRCVSASGGVCLCGCIVVCNAYVVCCVCVGKHMSKHWQRRARQSGCLRRCFCFSSTMIIRGWLIMFSVPDSS